MSSTNWNMRTFVKGASLLTLSAIVVKLLAAIYRVPFQNLVGDQGFYIYQQVYPFVGIFMIWTSYGLAVAVSKIVADCATPSEASGALRIAFFYLLGVAMLFFLLLTISAPAISGWMGDQKLTSLIKASAYIVLTMPFLAILKGAFQSEGQLVPVAISGVAEQLGRVAVILIGTWIALKAGASLYRAGEIAIWGAVVGEFVGVILLSLYFMKRAKTPRSTVEKWPVVKKLTIVSLSVSASSLLLLLYQLIDSFTVYNMLVNGGIGDLQAMELKGVYDRGQPLVQMGIVVATTLSLALVPLIAHHSSMKREDEVVPFMRLTFRVSFLFGVAATVGLMLILPAMNEMLFETRAGSSTLIVVVLQVFWLSLLLPAAAILQGRGKVRVPLLLFGLSMIVKVVTNYYLVPQFNIMGAAIAGNIGLLFIVVFLFVYFKKQFAFSLAPARFFSVVIVAASTMIMFVYGWQIAFNYVVRDVFPSRIGATIEALTSAMLGAVVFLFVCLKSRIMAEKEWYLLPFGKRLARLQLRLIKK